MNVSRCLLFFLTCLCLQVSAQIQGVVLDAQDDQPLPFATVRAGFAITQSDTKGSFVIQVSSAEPLIISYVGYETQRVDNPPKNGVFRLKRSVFQADEVIVNATRANNSSAMAFTNVSGENLKKLNLGQDLPVLLNFQPSVVSTSDAGAGVGYTGIRIRGTDATRINVTLNGIPYNDAESQGTFWVNMPDLASSVSSLQIQRGVGTSTNGAGAFGATINIQTNEYREKAYLETNHSGGSFGTLRNNVLVGTGLIKGKFTLDARLSRLVSEGYIDRAASNLRSFYTSAGYFGKKSLVRLNVFSGIEKTYQAWEGVPEAMLKTNRRFNVYQYDNQTDNYQQDHYQFVSSHQISGQWQLTANAFYVKGRGFYEQYKENEALAKYGLSPVVIGQETITETPLIRRRWLDNDFYGTVFSLDYDNRKRLKTSVGGGLNRYDGQHFGEVIWAKFASNGNIRHRYYDNDATKTDANIYTKTQYVLTEKLHAFADIQVRSVNYSFLGIDGDGRNVQQKDALLFFNPKIGITKYTSSGRAYLSFSVANKEPNRDDYTESKPTNRPLPERLYNTEAGYHWQGKNWAWNLGGYWMQYENQLILTGQLNDVGNYKRQNVPQSFRAGIEAELTVNLHKYLTFNGNFTASTNKIRNFTAFYDDYDAGGQFSESYKNTDIAFSPNAIAGTQLTYKRNDLELAWMSKYVGRQFLDNTSNTNRQLDAYFTNDLRLAKSSPKTGLTFSVLLNNVLNHLYESNGYTFSYRYEGKTTTENFYYPQAGFNFLVGIQWKL